MNAVQIEWTPEGISKLADWWEEKTPQELLALAVERFGTKVALACSFGAEDVVLVDMLVKINPEVPIFYLDTDKHFRETYETRDRMAARYGISFVQVKPALTLEEQAARYGDRLWERDPICAATCGKWSRSRRFCGILTPGSPASAANRRRPGPTRARWNGTPSSGW